MMVGTFLCQAIALVCRRRFVFLLSFIFFLVALFLGPWLVYGIPYHDQEYRLELFFVMVVLLIAPLVVKLAFCSGRKPCRPFVFWHFATLSAFGAAIVCAIFGDDHSFGCSPHSWWQPHAIWHILCGLALVTWWESFRSDSDEPKQSSRVVLLAEPKMEDPEGVQRDPVEQLEKASRVHLDEGRQLGLNPVVEMETQLESCRS